MLNIVNIAKLIDAAEEAYAAEVEADEYEVQQSASADVSLEEICERSDIPELNRYLEEKGIPFWLLDEPKVNPDKKYRVWINITKGGEYRWGLTPVR